MIILAYITLSFFFLRFLTVTINLIFSPVLKRQEPIGSKKVSVLIPARNEENNILNILKDLKNQSYRNIEVIVFNDQSTDRTRDLVKAFLKTDQRFHVVDSKGLPGGWLGKNNACHQLSLRASGDFLLFLDADVRVKNGSIESALAQMQKHQLKLLSVFPRQIMKTPGEKATVPIMNSILLSLLPMILTRTSPHSSLAAANGQFMFFEKGTYQKINPHETVKNQPVEDILIARMYKRQGLKMQCMTGNHNISCRMYHSTKEAVQGFSKNVAEFFGGSHFVAFLYWLIGTFGIFTVAAYLSLPVALLTLGLAITMKMAISHISRQSLRQNLIFSLPQQLLLGVVVIFSYRNKKRKKNQWKGRNINS